MIPKIAHFHWAGKPLPWLRMVGLWSFARQNPDWEVRLIRTPEHIKVLDLPSYGHEADWTLYEALYEHGGFAMHTDTVFVKPVPEQWCFADFTGCSAYGQALHHICFGAAQGSLLMKDCLDRCPEINYERGYQVLGVELINGVIRRSGGVGNLNARSIAFCDMSVNALTPIPWRRPQDFWKEEPLQLPEESVGATWFGASDISKEYEPKATPDSDYAIVQLAREVLSE